MPKKPTNTSKQTSLFDIRLKNEHDVLVLKGSPGDAASALLSGKIALSVHEPMTIKSLSLRLYATLRLNWNDNAAQRNSHKNVRHERKIFEHVWDNMEINKYLSNMYENQTSGGSTIPSRTTSSTSLKNHFRSRSSQNLSALGGSLGGGSQRASPLGSSTNLSLMGHVMSPSSNSSHTLVSGNYEFPFSSILPGDMPESVEGLPGGAVFYKLEALIDRGKFHSNMVTKKHIRVIRTLTTDAVELSETVAVDNTWPKKVEYSLNVPSKAIAIGSGTTISLMLVPLLKGLRLGETKIILSEYYSYMGYVPPVHNGEREIVTKVVPKPADDDANFQMDKWEVETFLRVPPSLSECTQDCDILNNVKVRHKIKFSIGLINPDGHVSELRASLPVQLFISPFVTVRTNDEESTVEGGSGGGGGDGSAAVAGDESNLLFNSQDQTLDPHLDPHLDLHLHPAEAASDSLVSFSGLIAPPLYEQHIYDRLWLDVSPLESPLGSGTATPGTYDTDAAADEMSQLSMAPIDSVQLNENLRLLSLQRQQEDDPDDYFNSRRAHGPNPALNSPGIASPAAHLSRAPSESLLKTSSQVPSYNHAIRSPDVERQTLSPAYEPPASVTTLSNGSGNEIASPTPTARSVSTTNLALMGRHSPAESGSSVGQPSSSASDRSAAINPRSNSSLNVYFLNKKEKKR